MPSESERRERNCEELKDMSETVFTGSRYGQLGSRSWRSSTSEWGGFRRCHRACCCPDTFPTPDPEPGRVPLSKMH